MLKVSLETLEKMTNYGAEDEPHRRVAGNFALRAPGTKSGSAVYFELEPGFELGNHTDAEEIVYIVAGTVEVRGREGSNFKW